MQQLHALVDRFRGVRVLVVGDAILDVYIRGEAARLSREGPVPVVDVRNRAACPGGAANTAANAAALGAETTLLSVLGTDADGAVLEDALARNSVDCARLVRSPAAPTVTKTRVLAGSQLLVRFDQPPPGAEHEVERRLVSALADAFLASDAVVVADYDGGVLGPRVVRALADLQRSAPRVVVVDSRHPSRFRSIAPTAVKPNREEALGLLRPGGPSADGADAAERVAESADWIFAATGARIVAVTLDSYGAVVLERGQP
ncbi:MAG: D-glycero-beta-D-manno-heptose 1-phosphate adenylyltransferase, partial [Thermoleophilia bacterium]|nr:D-glycero-beta-D-manno-heptose 1-phosphate adenylyltransferase [Thermoleophilia bacterium]